MLKIMENLNGKSLLLAVSGGLDSVCLLHFFKTNFKILGLKKIAVAHIDHALRNEESEKDALFVKELCQKWNVDFYFKSLKGILKKGNNLESRAREWRYQILQDFRRNGNFDYLLTAHHGNDQAETVLMRLARGTSISGLKAIQKFREDFVYRPFLHIPKQELNEYAKKYNLEWREDSSNQDTSFKRNLFRLKTLPFIDKNFPDYLKGLIHLPFIAEQSYRKIISCAENIFNPLVIPTENWPFPYEFCPYKKALCLDYNALHSTINSFGMAEIFRFWLKNQGFHFPLGEKGHLFYPFPKNRLQFRSILVEKSGKGLWFFKLDSFSPLDNLYLYNASADSVRETSVIWRFRQLGDFYIVKNSCRNRRKWSKWLQENGIPNAVRDYLPLLAEGSKIIRMGCPTDFVNNNSL